MIFDRIFDRQNLFVAGVDFREGRVKRSCLTATCRPGDKYDTMGLGKQCPERTYDAFVEAERRKVELDVAAVKNSDYDAFAVNRRRGCDAKIDVLTAHGHGNATVL